MVCGVLLNVAIVLFACVSCRLFCARRGRVEAIDVVNEMVKKRRAVRVGYSPVRVAVVVGDAVPSKATGDLVNAIVSDGRCSVEVIEAMDVGNSQWRDVDVIVVPGGRASGVARELGVRGTQSIRDFVCDGGGYVGICGGAYLGTNGYDWSLGLIDVQTLTGSMVDDEGVRHLIADRGAGFVTMQIVSSGSEVFGRVSSDTPVMFSGGPIFSVRDNESRGLPFVILGIFSSELARLECQRGTMVGSPAIIAGRCGCGIAMLISPHLEMSDSLQGMVVDAVCSVRRTE